MKKLLFLFLLFFLSFVVVSAELSKTEIDVINSNYSAGKNDVSFLGRYYLALKQSDISVWGILSFERSSWNELEDVSKFISGDLLGFDGYQKFNNSEYGLIVGFFAGLILWIFCKFRNLYLVLCSFVNQKQYKSYDPEKDLKLRTSVEWINFMAGRFWKVFLVAIVFFVLMYIPILNRIVQILSFQFLDISILAHSLILCILIGILPQLIQNYSNYRIKIHLEKRLLDMKAGARKQEIEGQVVRRR